MTTSDPKYKHKPSQKHTLEEVLKSLQDLIRNDLLDERRPSPPAEKPRAASAPAEEESSRERTVTGREDLAPTAPEAGPVNLNAVMRSLKDLIAHDLNPGDEAQPTAAESAPPPSGQCDAVESASAEFVPLDEELTFDDATKIVPPPLPTAMPELPGEIFPELASEPEVTPPASSLPKTEGGKKTAAGVQQELLLEVEPPADEHGPSAENRAPTSESETTPMTAAMAPAIASAPAAESPPGAPGDALPTIEVEETFDESAYFDAAARQAETSPPETPDMTASSTETSAESAPADNKIMLEIASEPAVESSPNTPSVDFDTIDFEPPRAAPTTPPAAAETPTREALTTAAPEVAPETMAAEEPPTAEIKTETKTEPAQAQLSSIGTSAPAANETHETALASETEPPPDGAPAPFNLDDIPVLQEVVAPPAGSMLVSESAPFPAQPRLASSDRARDIVVRAVAKLNIEMRKHGGVGLDTRTILRLQQLMREELEKDRGK